MTGKAVKKEKHPQLDLFVTDVLAWSPKADRHSLEHPFFSLSKKKDLKIRKYTSPDGKAHIEITPSIKGLATIYDKDILIYAASIIREAITRGVNFKENQPVDITAYNLLVSTNRGIGGKSYNDLEEALDRLMGTIIKTDITTNDVRQKEAFSLLENWKIVEKSPLNERMYSISIKLSNWLFNAIVNGENELLSINREYFKLMSGVERRIYEIGRKHCGRQPSWSIFMPKLYAKSGSYSDLREFRRMVKEVVARNTLPDYILEFDIKKDKLTFFPRKSEGGRKALFEALSQPEQVAV